MRTRATLTRNFNSRARCANASASARPSARRVLDGPSRRTLTADASSTLPLLIMTTSSLAPASSSSSSSSSSRVSDVPAPSSSPRRRARPASVLILRIYPSTSAHTSRARFTSSSSSSSSSSPRVSRTVVTTTVEGVVVWSTLAGDPGTRCHPDAFESSSRVDGDVVGDGVMRFERRCRPHHHRRRRPASSSPGEGMKRASARSQFSRSRARERKPLKFCMVLGFRV
jgi:hypothetical protein